MKESDITINVYPPISIKDYASFLPKILRKEFEISENEANLVINNDSIGVKHHFNNLLDDCYLLIESNYVDKVYRDSFYNYYSSKHYPYKKNCIRVSIFKNIIKEQDFKDQDRKSYLQDNYLGFIVLRPTIPFVLGRSFISPLAIKNGNFTSCIANTSSTAYGIKLNLKGFPHSSQDRETLSCAETTIWGIMEFFGQKYPQYSTVLPSDIIKALNNVTNERQIPSIGLNIEKISFALKSFNFGTKIYSKKTYTINTFNNLLSCYVESGIPLIIALQTPPNISPPIGHAVLCIGFSSWNDHLIDALSVTENTTPRIKKTIQSKGIRIFDHDDLHRKFVFMDDNLPAYSKSDLATPCSNYDPSRAADFTSCEITHFVAPLYPKIYLEAFQAKAFIKSFLIEGILPLPDNSNVYLRTFLTTSRSYKDWLVYSKFGPPQLKEYLLSLAMPKFIWVTEISTKELMKGNEPKANGLIILDSTEPNTQNNKAVIFAAYSDICLKFEDNTLEFKGFNISLPEFSIFENLIKFNPS